MQLETLEFEFSEARKTRDAITQGINANIDLTGAEVDKSGYLYLLFTHTSSYAPEASFIRLGGRARFSGPATEVRAAMDEWKRSRRITGTHGELIINAINYAASVNAVFIARIFNLTPPIAPPTIKFEAGAVGAGGIRGTGKAAGTGTATPATLRRTAAASPVKRK